MKTRSSPQPFTNFLANLLPMAPCCRGFTRLELAVLAGSVFLLLALALPALANKARSQQITCFNNLRQIGRAFHLWANDHNDLLPFYVPPLQGGTRPTNNYSAPAWFHFGVLSNELKTAKILACPSDVDKRPATDFSMDSRKGFLHSNFRNSAVSYFLAHPFWRDPANILSGDRNLRMDRSGSSCSVWGTPVVGLSPYWATTAALWTNGIHFTMGHLLLIDGRVEATDNSTLIPVLRQSNDENNSMHFVMP